MPPGTVRPKGMNMLCSIETAMTASATAWRGGDLGRGIDLAHRAALATPAAGADADCRAMAGVWYAFLLTFARRLDEASRVLDAVLAGARGAVSPKVMAAAGMGQAEIHFAHDRMEAAAVEAEAALTQLEGAGPNEFRPLAHALLARRALRCADTGLALQYVDRLTTGALLNHGRHMPARGAWVTAEVRHVRGGHEQAAPIVRALITEAPLATELLAAQPEAAAWMVRAARALGDEDLAALAVQRSTALAARNPSLAAMTAGATHALALFERDHRRLEAVADRHPGRWGRASALEDAGTVLARDLSANPVASAGDPAADQAGSARCVELLGHAAEHYQAIGAARDDSRVARKLRALGMRRTPGSRAGRSTGDAGRLTGTEAAVADLVSQGLTNARVGQELFISPHTVAAHLKKIFRKLDLTSRAELAGQWAQHKDRAAPA
jgi:DNA-binding CsgD family transcriptional regulator